MESTTRKILIALGLVLSLVPFCVAMVGFYRFLMYIGYDSPVWVILMVPALMFEALLHFGGILYAIQFWQTAQYPKSIAISSILAVVNLVWVGTGTWFLISPDTIAEFGNYEKMYDNEQSLSGEDGEEEEYPPGYGPEYQPGMPMYQPGEMQPGMQPGFPAQPGNPNTGANPDFGLPADNGILFDDPLLLPPGGGTPSFPSSGTRPSPGGGTPGSSLFPGTLPPLDPLD